MPPSVHARVRAKRGHKIMCHLVHAVSVFAAICGRARIAYNRRNALTGRRADVCSGPSRCSVESITNGNTCGSCCVLVFDFRRLVVHCGFCMCVFLRARGRLAAGSAPVTHLIRTPSISHHHTGVVGAKKTVAPNVRSILLFEKMCAHKLRRAA